MASMIFDPQRDDPWMFRRRQLNWWWNQSAAYSGKVMPWLFVPLKGSNPFGGV